MVKKELLSLQMECTILFQTNPTIVETIEGLGKRLGREKEVIQPVIEMLVKQGIIEQIGEASSLSFRYKEPVTNTKLETTSELEKL